MGPSKALRALSAPTTLTLSGVDTLVIKNSENFIQIDVTPEEEEGLPSYGDAYVTIFVESNGFSGRNDLWVTADDMKRFCKSLVQLEVSRKGEAFLESVSPGELVIKIYASDELGHMAVSGQTGYLVIGEKEEYKHSVEFGFDLDPSEIQKAVNTDWVRLYAI